MEMEILYGNSLITSHHFPFVGNMVDGVIVTNSLPSSASHPLLCDSSVPPTRSGIKFPALFIYVGFGHMICFGQ